MGGGWRSKTLYLTPSVAKYTLDVGYERVKIEMSKQQLGTHKS